MTQKLIKIKKSTNNMLPKSSKVAIKSTIISFIIAFISSSVCYIFFRSGVQPYNDVAVGNITLSGIYKNIDFYSYYTFIFIYIIMFLVLNVVYNRKEELLDDMVVEMQPYHYVIGLLPSFIMMLLKMSTVPVFNLFYFLYLSAIIICLKKYKVKNENIIKLVTSCYFIYLSSSGVFALTAYYLPNIADRGTRYFIPLFLVLLCVAGYVIYLLVNCKFKENEDTIVDRITAITQLFIPFCLFSLINTRYYYQGNQYIPVYYDRFKKGIIVFILLLCIINLIRVIKTINLKRRINDVSLSTVISIVAVCFWNTGYNLLINTDQFHTGETAVVFQQTVEMGQKFGSEFVSVLQGLGFSLSWLNNIVFGGTYSTYVQSQNLLLVFMAVLTVVLLYPIIEHKFLILLIGPIMPLFYMNRIYLIAPIFLFLLNPKIIKNPVKWSYCYILTCIIHVWYQPTYGGAVAASLIPVLFSIWYREFKNNSIFIFQNNKSCIKIGMFLLSVAAIGICCIPMLLNAIHFLRTNGYETTIANGVSAIQTITYAPNYLTGYTLLDMVIQFILKFGSGLVALIVMLYMFTKYVVIQNDYIKKVQGAILTVATSISYIMMLPAIFTRIDPGISRIGGTGFVFFGLLIAVLIYLYRDDIKIKPIALLICGLSLCAGFYVTYPPYLQVHQKANSIVYIPDDAIYAKPEETGLDNLGYAFVQDEQYLHEAMVIKEICSYLLNEDQTYYDLTDKSIYYLLTDKKVPGLYVSSMVCANEMLQTESLERLKENDVPLVFINRPLRYMGVTESLRSYRIYRYFMEQGYNFVRYKGCNFMVRNDVNLSPIQDSIEPNVASNLIGVSDNLINESIYNTTMLEKLTKENISANNNIEVTDDNMFIAGSDPFLVFNPVNKIEFKNIQLIEINLKDMLLSGMSGQLFVETENATHNEYNTIHFDIKTNRILIPIYNYEQFKLDSKLVNLRLDFDNVIENSDVTVESIKLYSLNEEQKASLAQQFDIISGNMSDNRLDDLFHQINLMNLPNQWGQNFKRMEERFTASGTVICEQQEVRVNDAPVSVYFDMKQIISGNEGEFLRLKLDYGDSKQRNATIVVKGIDKNGKDLYEEFQFATVSDNMLIPISSSPNCLQAQEIKGFDVIFAPGTESYEVRIEEAQMYKLTK